ncbi:MAG: 16S rRNA (cytosine(1402)-N(4))-methyltransferase RsmH [FCB group bacterium]|nr:16S rRNA (cytosine(1402)-N(4))-methyltransferase RsmH [FCB group bacterium]
MTATNSFHQPVLADEAVDLLVTDLDGAYIDATAGGGSHSLRIISKLTSSGRLLAIDRDEEAVAHSRQKLQEYSTQAQVLRGDFGHLRELAEESGMTPVNGVLFDLGVSSHQLDSAIRGFSYRENGPLDLRLDRATDLSAGDVINDYSPKKLIQLLFEYGEERNAKKIVSAIVDARTKASLTTTAELAGIIKTVTNPRYLNKTLSRVFQAIRIEVNDEMVQLQSGLADAVDLLQSGGRLVVIAYHSLEDRIVKWFMREQAKGPSTPLPEPFEPRGRIITKKPLIPTREEISENPRARSAKMRVMERL